MERFTRALGRSVTLREGTADEQTWIDSFEMLYHVPPLREAKTVLDLGANIGLTCAHYQCLFPKAKIVGYEMDSENWKLATINAPGVTLCNEAVSIEAGVGHFDRQGWEASYKLGSGEVEVAVTTIPEIIDRSFNGGGIDFLKMDIEGEEWPIMLHYEGWAPYVGALLVELHETPWHAAESLLEEGKAALETAGFQVRVHKVHPRALYATR